MKKGEAFYDGKAKTLFKIEGSTELIYQEFKNSLTAFNGVKKAEMEGKGSLNRDITSLIFRYLQKRGRKTHWIADSERNGMITKKVEIIPLEVVVRNTLAGSLAKKFELAEGVELERPIVDFHFKKDELGDPFISEEHAEVVLKVATKEELQTLRRSALAINNDLIELFEGIGLRLVDFKLEFGRLPSGEIVLADEISPDSCRLWDKKTGEKRDKDRFRRDLGQVLENYEWVYSKLKERWGTTV